MNKLIFKPWKLVLAFLLFLILSNEVLAQDSIQQINVYVNRYGLANQSNNELASLPGVQKRLSLIETTLKKSKPIIFWNEFNNDTFFIVQLIATNDSSFCKYIFSEETREAFLSQVFGIYPSRIGDLPKGILYENGRYYRIEMYNFSLNLSSVAIVDFITKKIVKVQHYKQMQADLPKSLIDLALEIATNAPQVANALGYKPNNGQAQMAGTKTALNKTRCERSMHLCVAPTFVTDNRALWAIVDITDMRLVGTRWTQLGDVKDLRVTERKLQNNNIQDCFCEKVTTVKRDAWEFDYMLTSSDGLMIEKVRFNNKLVFNSAKLVDWHVNYSNTEGMGYSDAVGCPMFSQSAVVATEPPIVAELIEGDSNIGFVLEQQYYSELWPTPCNYSYSQRYLFYKDGRIRFTIASLGRGCGNDGTYRPVMRIEPAGNSHVFSDWKNNHWNKWLTEKWQLQNEFSQYQNNRFLYQYANEEGEGYYIEPAKGQFKDGGRGDYAYTYITKNHTDRDEGSGNLVTIGPCCNIDYKQGPEKFIEEENIENSAVVIWYVPQMKNDNTPGKEYCWAKTELVNGIYRIKTYPCIAGPMFVPIKNVTK